MDHRIYGIIIFAGIILLIYLLNYNYIYQNKEGFYGVSDSTSTSTSGSASPPTSSVTEEKLLEGYNIYDNTYINLSNLIVPETESQRVSLKDALILCNKNTNAIGVTKDKTVLNKYYLISKNDYCKTQYMGSDLEKDKVLNFKTYIKKSIINSDLMCINDNLFDKRYISIGGNNNLYWMVDNDNKIQSVDISKIDITGKYIKTRFKIVKGLSGTNTVSFKYVEGNHPDRYVVNDYPKKSYLYLREINSNELDWKNKASFRISPSLTYSSSEASTNTNIMTFDNKKKYSLKIIGFPNMYIIANEISKNFLNIISSETIATETYEKTDFMFLPELTKESILQIEQTLTETDESSNGDNDLTPTNKFEKMKTKNLYTLDKQSNMLDNQNGMMNAYDFIHTNNMSNIRREFANQSAILALSKYIEEKENMEEMQKDSTGFSPQGLPDNTPSVSSIKPRQ
jgi:hypothetical protein